MTELAVRYAPTELDTESLGDILVKSGYFRDSVKEPAQAIVKILAGRELGFGPMASMQGVYLVNGRVTLSANLVGAAIKRSGKYDYRVAKLDNTGCTIKFFEQGKDLGDSSFTLDDAKKAGLAGGEGMYAKYVRNMLFARALTNGARWYCPDVFNGPIYTPDELGAQVDLETGEVIADEPPVPAERYVPTDEREVDDKPRPRMQSDRRGKLLERYGALLTRARHAGVVQDASVWVISPEMTEEEITERGLELQGRINALYAESARSEAPAELTTPPAF